MSKTVVSKLHLIFSALAVIVVCQAQIKVPKSVQDSHQASLRAREITVATQVWVYDRIYPLLDGLFQDVAATQVSTLTLSPNASNGVNLDALQQSFQAQLQYSQLAGIQNATSAQVASANAAFQTQLAEQGSQLLQQYIQATALATQAQTAFNTLSASPNASSTDIATAQQVLTASNAMVTTLGGALANLKSVPAPTVPPAASPLASAPAASTGLGTTLLTNGANTATSGIPTFPATKQMDNQMDMLWERLSRLVGVMAKPDSMMPDDRVALVKFDTTLSPIERKKQLVDITYKLNCGSVIDLFPRTAALNITEDKYRDTSIGLGAVLNFLGLGGTIAYNREHLTATQLLGQSSYITGHGVGQQEFGWLYGISLGDDSIAPGTRTTFALIDIPTHCTGSVVDVKDAAWTQAPKFRIASPAAEWVTDTPRTLLPADATQGTVNLIDFSRIEYDPAAGRAAPVMMTIGLTQDMDQQQTVTVNGQFIQRVRDNFGRAVTASANNSGGALEAQGSVAINTWIPTNPHTMLLNVDASLFGDHFPRIVLNSPKGSPIVVNELPANAPVTVSGRRLDCSLYRTLANTSAGTPAFEPPAGYCLPSLGYQKSTPVTLGVSRWIAKGSSIDRLSITVTNTPAAGTVSNPGGVPAIQVVSDLDTPTWGANAEVDQIKTDGTLLPLSCAPAPGSRLVCQAPDANQAERVPLTLQVIDQNHSGGPIKGFATTEKCKGDGCAQPLVWKTNSPALAQNNSVPAGKMTPDLSNSQWSFKIVLVNVTGQEKATLAIPSTPPPSASHPPGTPTPLEADVVCVVASEICTATFTIARARLGGIADTMALDIIDPGTQKSVLSRPISVTNLLANIRPLVSTISPDFKIWWGQNLVYSKISVAGNGYDVQCDPTGAVCAGSAAYGQTAGLVYFFAEDAGLAFPLMQVNTLAANTPVTYTPPPPPKATDSSSDKATTDKPAPGGTAPKPTPGGKPPATPVPPGTVSDQIHLFTNQQFSNSIGTLAPRVFAIQ